MNTNVLILLSGGIDSFATAHYYTKRKDNVKAFFVDYGQLSARREKEAATKICDFLDVNLIETTVQGPIKWGAGYIPARNSLLLNLGLAYFPFEHGIMALGIHAGTLYADSTEFFLNTMQSIFDLYSDGRIVITAPFINSCKSNILKYSKKNELPLKITYSCELGKEQPCEECNSCRELKRLYKHG